MSYNKNFELGLRDIELIEKCLNDKINRLFELRLTHIESTIKPVNENSRVKEIDEEIQEVHDLLGRLHNQKVWYRPDGVYVGG